jgi:hypothetical protein
LDGVCVGEDVVCPDPKQCKVIGTCNPATGIQLLFEVHTNLDLGICMQKMVLDALSMITALSALFVQEELHWKTFPYLCPTRSVSKKES